MDNEAKEVFKTWKANIQSARDVRNHSLRVLHDQKLKAIEEKRKLFRTVIELSAGIIIAPEIFNLTHDRHFYFVGVGILSATVVFIVLLFREIIDGDFEGLQRSEDDMVAVLDRKISILEKYIRAGIFTYETDKNQYNETIETSEAKKLAELDQRLKNNRENRDKLPKDYTGELIMFLFLSGTFWVLAGILPQFFSWALAVLVEILILIITSINSAQLMSRTFSMLQDFTRRQLKYFFLCSEERQNGKLKRIGEALWSPAVQCTRPRRPAK